MSLKLNDKEIKKAISKITEQNGYFLISSNVEIISLNDIVVNIKIKDNKGKVYTLDNYMFDPTGHQDEFIDFYKEIIQKVNSSPWT